MVADSVGVHHVSASTLPTDSRVTKVGTELTTRMHTAIGADPLMEGTSSVKTPHHTIKKKLRRYFVSSVVEHPPCFKLSLLRFLISNNSYRPEQCKLCKFAEAPVSF